ncbi:MAG TPA: hypothetical protein VEX62_04315 [Candidatus Limnocylindrales bacterium]|jgi:hypothetical protein|nr:hypothetical protein [Candidatus Limnocylindrales bacterium]
MRREIKETLALWREAERQLDSIREGEGESPAAIAREREVIRLRARFQHLTAVYMLAPVDELNVTMRDDRVQAMSAEAWGSSMAFGRSTVKQ